MVIDIEFIKLCRARVAFSLSLSLTRLLISMLSKKASVARSCQTSCTALKTVCMVCVVKPLMENRKFGHAGSSGTTLNVMLLEDQTPRSRSVCLCFSVRLWIGMHAVPVPHGPDGSVLRSPYPCRSQLSQPPRTDGGRTVSARLRPSSYGRYGRRDGGTGISKSPKEVTPRSI
jgi:hypothetical protein